MEGIRIQGTGKGYVTVLDGSIVSHRCECDSHAKRCYFSNGQEAGV